MEVSVSQRSKLWLNARSLEDSTIAFDGIDSWEVGNVLWFIVNLESRGSSCRTRAVRTAGVVNDFLGRAFGACVHVFITIQED